MAELGFTPLAVFQQHWVGAGAYAPWRQQREGAPIENAVIVLRHKLYKYYMGSVQGGMGMQKEIMCVE